MTKQQVNTTLEKREISRGSALWPTSMGEAKKKRFTISKREYKFSVENGKKMP